MATTATEDGDSYVLNGKKAFCTSGPVADVITVYATTDAEAGATGITAFVVETDTPGIRVGEPIPKMGLNTSPIGELEFTDCRVPKEQLIGKPGGAFFMLEHVMTWEILCIFIMMVGEMQRRLEQCIALRQEAHAVRRADRLEPVHPEQDRRPEDRRRHLPQAPLRHRASASPASGAWSTEIAIAKLVTSEANLASALSAVQIFGGRGYMREAGLEKELRAAVGAPIYSGTNEMQRIRIASMLGLIRPGWKSF